MTSEPITRPPTPPVQPHYKEVNHLLHFVLTILTGSAWAWFVWPWLTIAVNAGNKRKEQDYQQALVTYEQAMEQYRSYRDAQS